MDDIPLISSFCIPDNIILRVFDLINEVRVEYSLTPLVFSKELSFLAGEHACNMSTGATKYGHRNYGSRQVQTPMATTFSENIARVSTSEDPAQEIVLNWLRKPTNLSRIISAFTHTGIGIAESEDGKWYCVQIFASFNDESTNKGRLLLLARFINRLRLWKKLQTLSISMFATNNLMIFAKAKPELLSNISPSLLESMFYMSSTVDVIQQSYQTPHLPQFMEYLASEMELPHMQERINTMAFYTAKLSDTEYKMVLLVARAKYLVPSLPELHISFPLAYNAFYLVNSYRTAKGLHPLTLSHQFCKLCANHCLRMKEREREIEYHSLAKIVMKAFPEGNTLCAVYMLDYSGNPLNEMMLQWLTSDKSRRAICGDGPYFGFALVSDKKGHSYIARIIGSKTKEDRPIEDNGRYSFYWEFD